MDPTIEAGGGSRFSRTFRALRGRDFRLWYAGQGVSLIGTFLQQTAISWYLFRITGSTAALGRVALASQLPTIFAVPFAGVLADRIPRQAGVVTTQSLMALQSLALAWMVASGRAGEGTVLVLSALLGLLMGFDIPIRQSFMSQVVPSPGDLPNALALNSALFNLARLAGPALAGLAVATWGEGPCLWTNAASFLAVIAAVVALRPSPAPPVASGSVRGDFREGLRRARRDPQIRDALLLVAALSLGSLSMLPLLPAVAARMLGGGPRELGLLMSSAGCGALVATLTLAGRRGFENWRRKFALSAMVAVAGLFLLSASHGLLSACLGMVLVGFGTIQVTTGANTLLQSRVEERLRGRIVSLFVLAFSGMSPLGSLAMGHLAAVAGIRIATLISAIFCLVVVSAWAFAARSHRVAS